MTTTTSTTAANPFAALTGSASSTSGTAKTANQIGSADNFLKLLVTQMQNQDPLNPMENAEVTSQLAQINTVTGLDKVNSSLQALSSQFMQMQALQSVSLVGRDVVLQGNKLYSGSDGKLRGGFEIASAADAVKVEVLDSAGKVVDTLQLGNKKPGQHEFDWTQPSSGATGTTFRITATSGSTTLTSTSLIHDRIASVTTGGSTLQLKLAASGNVSYDAIKAFN